MNNVSDIQKYLRGYAWDMKTIELANQSLNDPKYKGDKDSLLRRIERAERRKLEIETAIVSVADRELSMLLQLAYIEDLPLEVVADRMGRSYSHVTKLHRRALQAIELP